MLLYFSARRNFNLSNIITAIGHQEALQQNIVIQASYVVTSPSSLTEQPLLAAPAPPPHPTGSTSAPRCTPYHRLNNRVKACSLLHLELQFYDNDEHGRGRDGGQGHCPRPQASTATPATLAPPTPSPTCPDFKIQLQIVNLPCQMQ